MTEQPQQVGKIEIGTHYDKKNEMLMLNTSIMHSKWCIRCYPKKEPAEFIFCGNSLCEECFKTETEYRRREEDEG